MSNDREFQSEEFIEHYGTPRHSGRYPWGSGKNPQRSKNFLQRADDLAAQGLSKKEIARAFKMSTGDYVAMRRVYKDQLNMENQMKAIKYHDKGWSNTAIAEELGVSEGTVRNMLDPNKKMRENKSRNIAEQLKNQLKERPYLDIGEGVEKQLNVSEEQLRAARIILDDEGYNIHSFKLNQVTNPRQFTNMVILTEGDKTKADVKAHLGEITSPHGLYFKDNGGEAVTLKPIPSIDSKRIAVRYDEEGGGAKDGVIEIRRGTEDLWLGGRNYAQVRIGVDGTHYLKGMAIYGNDKDMPPGVDVVFNTSKHKGTPLKGEGDSTVLKPMKKDPQNKAQMDPQNPFGAAFRQWSYDGSDGKEHTSPINIVNDDEDWEGWKKNLSSQFLSKQPTGLAKRQLDVRYTEMADEFETLKSLTIPTLKKQLLEDFADSCDSSAVYLKAAALPRQGSFAILPVPSLKDNEVYAPMYNDGEEVILVRHPHEGVFQIPRLIVNNRSKDGKETIGNTASHAIGINPTVANQLSGADYDGDTVLVIPTKGQTLKASEPLEGLKGFSPSEHYSRDPNDKMVTGKSTFDDDGNMIKKGDGFNKGLQMGIASNLITDMTIKGAKPEEIERAVRYSMTVIDAEKHNLDWKRCALDNDIDGLKKKYQRHVDPDGTVHEGGASTLISAARSPVTIMERKEVYSKTVMTPEELKRFNAGDLKVGQHKMTPEELERYNQGEVIYRDTGRTYVDKKTGKVVRAPAEITKMESVRDAHLLSSGYVIEEIYADHANRMKALANEARKEARATEKLEKNKTAEKAYADEVESLKKKMDTAALEAPKERQAMAIARSNIEARIQSDPSLKDKDNADKLRKISAKAMDNARDQVNGGIHKKRYRIELTDDEWDAIQAGAISDNQLKKILRYSDLNEVKKRAMPKESFGMKDSTKARAKALLNAGWTIAEVAEDLGVSASTLRKEFDNFKGFDLAKGGD